MSQAGDRARVSVTVAVAPAVAFAVFTEETDLWWRRGPKFRPSGRSPGVLSFEPGVGGRLFERFGSRVIEMGRITVWQPPARFEFEWRGTNFAPGEVTQVAVEFAASASGTLVTLEHRGWSSLRPGHPARHGLEGAAVSRLIGLWWGELMSSLREHAAARG